MRFGIIGAGVVGTALAVKLEHAGHFCVGVHTRSKKSFERFQKYLPDKELLDPEDLVPEVEVLFITTQDDMIKKVAEGLAEKKLGKQNQLWIHCSGSLSSNILKVKPQMPVSCLSLHPLQAFANVESALTILEGTHFGVEGDEEEEGEAIVRSIGGIPHRLKTKSKSLYHAGAVMASNYFVVLASMAVDLFLLAGIEPEDALESLLPLMRGTLHNLNKVGLPEALTGPIARGDSEVVKGHLEQMPPYLAEIYKMLGVRALDLGKAKLELKGLSYDPEISGELLSLLQSSNYKEG